MPQIYCAYKFYTKILGEHRETFPLLAGRCDNKLIVLNSA